MVKVDKNFDILRPVEILDEYSNKCKQGFTVFIVNFSENNQMKELYFTIIMGILRPYKSIYQFDH
jgi:hypothetical protein